MLAGKPSILIYSWEPDEDLLREVCAGIEEEGVLYQKITRKDDLDTLAWEAANDSMLGVGIGISGVRMAMQMQQLPKGKNVFELNAPHFWQCRNLGSNSARAVKKMMFRPVYEAEKVI
jgi:hypothetical protein